MNKMSEGDHVEFEGTVVDAMRDIFCVKLDDIKEGQEVTVKAKLSGKMRQKKIQVLPGDSVRVKVSPYDMSLGMITWRIK
jgi:translation initiation factor IF-1